ncbi:hypothetical protein BT63DRAFT_482750 [Microthyrium microscopicum]|uniref:Lysine-specific metallo-endopeptidase domain-containing protein n=1 Tax=Microthyrium microscopicum TaxID=703497 RepID=A0A6A6TXN2_9PEZI|nr:hypothetical protein BT63DRAFT_482750 [Microthyrium microscopicum]
MLSLLSFMALPRVAVLLSTLLLFSPASAQSIKSLDDLFTLKAGDSKGGCDKYKTQLTAFLPDIQALVDAGIEASDPSTGAAIQNNKNAITNLFTFYNFEFDNDGNPLGKNKNPTRQEKSRLGSIHGTFNDLKLFLENGYTAIERLENTKPWLFCDSSWLEETETAYDEDGNPEQNTDTGAAAGSTYTVRNIPIKDAQGKQTDNFELYSEFQTPANADPDNWDKYAYYSPDFKLYMSTPKAARALDNGSGGRSWCNGDVTEGPSDVPEKRRYGITTEWMASATITLCPSVFGSDGANWNTLNDMKNDARSSTYGTALESRSIKAITLMHEMIHLLKGNDDTPDAATYSDGVLGLTKDQKAASRTAASKNPDTYVYFSLSYWLTKNIKMPAPANTNNAPSDIDWSAGVSKGEVRPGPVADSGPETDGDQ